MHEKGDISLSQSEITWEEPREFIDSVLAQRKKKNTPALWRCSAYLLVSGVGVHWWVVQYGLMEGTGLAAHPWLASVVFPIVGIAFLLFESTEADDFSATNVLIDADGIRMQYDVRSENPPSPYIGRELKCKWSEVWAWRVAPHPWNPDFNALHVEEMMSKHRRAIPASIDPDVVRDAIASIENNSVNDGWRLVINRFNHHPEEIRHSDSSRAIGISLWVSIWIGLLLMWMLSSVWLGLAIAGTAMVLGTFQFRP